MAEPGELIAERYRLDDRLGGGAMGVVWRAHDTVLDRDVAVKELLTMAGMTVAQAHEANQRAMREARIAARLHHPHAISVYDVAEHAGRPCLIMEFMSAKTMSDMIAEAGGRLPVDQVTRIGIQLADALAAAHAAGIVHRDVKPGNVLVTEDGTAKLTDFGISRAAGDSTITATGILAGTPAYLAPEVAQGHETIQASDVFSLGATLFCAVEGEPPFGLNPNPIALLYKIANDPVPPPQSAGPLTDVLTRLLSANPDRRPTARQAERALSGIDLTPVSMPAPAPVAAPTKITPMPVAAPAPAAATKPGNRRRTVIAAAVVLVVLLAATGILVALLNNHNDNQASGHPPPVPSTSQPAPATSTTRQQPATTTRTTTTTQTPVQTTAPAAPPPTSAAPPAGDVSDQLVSAITGYYQLVPGDLSDAWNHMTADYQQNHAGGMSGYQQFWQPISRVSTSDVVASPPDSVTATITYFYRSGNVVVERTEYGMVQQDGIWKIASSSVLSHSGTPD